MGDGECGFKQCGEQAVEVRYDGLGLCCQHAYQEMRRTLRKHAPLVWALKRLDTFGPDLAGELRAALTEPQEDPPR